MNQYDLWKSRKNRPLAITSGLLWIKNYKSVELLSVKIKNHKSPKNKMGLIIAIKAPYFQVNNQDSKLF